MTKRKIKKNKFSAKKLEKKINFILEFRALKHSTRTCKTFLKNLIPENIAEHTFYATIIGWVLAKMGKADENKVIKMCLIHDLAEVRGGERNLVNKFYNQPLNEEKIIKEIVEDYELGDFLLLEIFQEFIRGETFEAQLAKDADILSQMLLEKECFDHGNFKAKRWLSTSLERLKTKEGRELGEVLYDIDSDKWWLAIIKKYILLTEFLSPDGPFFHLP